MLCIYLTPYEHFYLVFCIIGKIKLHYILETQISGLYMFCYHLLRTVTFYDNLLHCA